MQIIDINFIKKINFMMDAVKETKPADSIDAYKTLYNMIKDQGLPEHEEQWAKQVIQKRILETE